MLKKYKNEKILMITTNENKKRLLKNLDFYNIKFMTIEEFKKNFYYDYNFKTIDYLIKKYNYNIDVCKVILNNLYDISITKKYTSQKLNNLVEIKKELLKENLLIENKTFKKYVSTKKILIQNYYNLEKYIIEDLEKLNTEFLTNSTKEVSTYVVKNKTLEDEVFYVINEIIKLLKKDIPLTKIYLANVKESDYYTINKMFNYFNIPINLNDKISIYGTKIVKEYLENKTINLENNDQITSKLVQVINSLVEVENSNNYNLFLIDKLKSASISKEKYNNAVNVIDLKKEAPTEDEHVFVLSFNQDILPHTYKDEDFISDNLKEEINLYTTTSKNIQEKEIIKNILSNINNLYLSYHLQDNFATYIKSSLIKELNLEEITSKEKEYNYSNYYNKILLMKDLDTYYKYNEIGNNLPNLYNTYKNEISYNNYSNKFTGINNKKLLDYIKKPMIVSYTSINNYNKCAFSYYINNLLKLNIFEENFNLFLGNLFHKLAQDIDEDITFEDGWNEFLKTRELNIKEKIFLNNLKDKVEQSINIIKEQHELTNYKDNLYEKSISIDLDKKIDVVFNGKIDKIMTRKNVSDTYFSVIDYKTGFFDTNLTTMKYGLNMQLPIYLYLISCSNLFTSAIFTGMYYQKAMPDKIKWDKKKTTEDLFKDGLKLEGYSTNEKEELLKFDPTYENSTLIKSMRTKKDEEFYNYTKLFNHEEILNIINFTDKLVNETVDKILEGNFSINPKIIDNKEISCEFCKYQDICYVTQDDKVRLAKVDNLDFLGGEE